MRAYHSGKPGAVELAYTRKGKLSMTGRYKAVLFDLDGTLRLPSPSPVDAFLQFARTLEIAVDAANERKVRLWAHHYWSQHEQIQIDMERYAGEEFWNYYSRLLLECIGVNENLAELGIQVRLFFDNAYSPHVQRAPGSRQTLSALKDAGYQLGLLSNRWEPLDAAVAELELDGLFDVTLAAGEIGYWKPNPTIFNHMVGQFKDLQPNECLYVGDNYYADGDGALAAGLVPIIFDPDNLYQDFAHDCIQEINQLLAVVLSDHENRHPITKSPTL